MRSGEIEEQGGCGGEISAADLKAVQDLYEAGLYLQAYERSRVCGPLRTWRGAEARIMAARLAGQLGAPRLGLWHRLRAWREAPHHPEVCCFRGYTVLEWEGPYEAWRFFQQQGADLPDATPDVQSSWFAFGAQVLGYLRDFEAAESWLRRAEQANGHPAWVLVMRSLVLELEDRREEALAAADEALRVQPWYRPAVQARAHLLTLLNRDDEAFAFLTEAAQRIECPALYWQLGGIYYEREDYARVAWCLDQFEAMSPLLERTAGHAFHGLRSFLAYLSGDDQAAIDWARRSRNDQDQAWIERLLDPQRKHRPRRVLPVGFVGQHYITCGPATLASLGRYWSMPADHLEVAEQICYDGTTDLSERRWAETHGWAVREFTVTEAAAEAAVAAGVPFALTTKQPNAGHLQAVVGYDGRRGSLILRDPSSRYRREVLADEFLEHYAAFGPRGMAMVPAARAELLAQLDLTDAPLWDQRYRFLLALERHAREEAAEILARMQAAAPDHPLTWHVELQLAAYDGNPQAQLAAVEKLLARFPKDAVLQLNRLSLLRNMSRRDALLETLAQLSSDPEADSVFLLLYAQELAADARQHELALTLLRKALRKRPSDPQAYHTLAELYWGRQQFAEALPLYRFAVCLNDKDEELAESYFRAARHCRQTETALEWLRKRWERFGHKSALPTYTLVHALENLERTPEALEVLERALAWRPDDGELRLFAAQFRSRVSAAHTASAQQLLQEARHKVSETLWLSVAAQLARQRGDLAESLELYQQVLRLQPQSLAAHRAVSTLLAELRGRQAAIDHLHDACRQFPHFQPLLELLIEWLRGEPPEEVEPVIRQLIVLNPAHAWAVRELGLLLVQQHRIEEAERLAREALQLDPWHPASHALHGEVCMARGDRDQARAAFRQAVRISVDYDHAIARLLDACETLAQRRTELGFVRDELVRQVVYGDGLLAFRQHARTVLEDEELLQALQDGLAARPDLWHAWSACVQQLASMNRLQQAEELARQATERFPQLPRAWLDLADIYQARCDLANQLAAIQTAYSINPSWSLAARRLAETHLLAGDAQQACTVLEQATRRDPLDPLNFGFLAEVLWLLQRHEPALACLEQAVKLEPQYSWAWDRLCEWSQQLDAPQRPQQAARQLVEQRPGDPSSWMVLAQVLPDEALQERLDALRRAAELDQRCVEAYDEQARLLALAGRHEEALAAARAPHVWNRPPPLLLARAAWCEWTRGNRDIAYEQMRQALDADPASFGMWQMFADWAADLHRTDDYLLAAQQMVRLNPQSETAFGYRAHALLVSGKRAEAKRNFRRALHIEPRYAFAASWLFDLHFEDGELDEAGQALEKLRAADKGAYALVRGVQWAAAKRDHELARQQLRELCFVESDDWWPFHAALEAMNKAGWQPTALAVLRAAIAQPHVAPRAGWCWARLKVMQGEPPKEQELLALAERGPLGDEAAYGYLDALGERNRKRAVRRFVNRHPDWLCRSTRVWGAAVYALVATSAWPHALRWARRWKEYQNLEGWMLYNVAEAFWYFQQDAEAAEVHRHALTLKPDGTYSPHLVRLACHALNTGDVEQAGSYLQRVDADSLPENMALLYQLARTTVELVPLAQQQRREAYRTAWPRICAAARACKGLAREVTVRRVWHQSLWRLAKLVRTLPAWWRAIVWRIFD
jgi:tetratricopeptide (TPR) repeat protein